MIHGKKKSTLKKMMNTLKKMMNTLKKMMNTLKKMLNTLKKMMNTLKKMLNTLKKMNTLKMLKTLTAISLPSLRPSRSDLPCCTVKSVEIRSQQRMNRPVDATSQNNRHDVRFVY
ncbi:hypothetical protein BU25DRAFT_261597 [Macroventuria anomochaeta]|uniref:Uncharacterized protein n=1 Tax=Macroventuria anomochaeta TaxID=301207 RepID=A0ACB6S6P1_9PLEO|nr:uncharacterized protein BU25DRAFT_261597 [Macroventuria anomochaeta]KAF2629930.1 hypothetical protein BU25DRAFT_261597 [Macroventuria anomochaeta]